MSQLLRNMENYFAQQKRRDGFAKSAGSLDGGGSRR
jgi:hypothetical protein